MHRAVLLGLLLTATACASQDISEHSPTTIPEFTGTGFQKFISDTHTFSADPNLPESSALNVLRVEALAAPMDPLSAETGTIWPGPPAPIKSLRDLQLESGGGMPPEPRLPTARQLGEPGAAYVPAPKAAPSSATGSDTVLTNADGSRTIIHSDGRVEFKPAPK